MNAAQWVLLLTVLFSWYNVGLIGMVQVSYRLWAYVAPMDFHAYHVAWWYGWRGIQPMMFPPAGFAALGAIALLWLRPSGVPLAGIWLGIGIQVLIWLLTGIIWAPWQMQFRQRLPRQSDGTLTPLYLRLLTTHWLRVGLITAFALVMVGLLVQSQI